MRLLIIALCFILSSCANVASTRMTFKTENTTLILDMPKEVVAKNLKVKLNAQQNSFEITSDSWVSTNQGTIEAQSGREKAFLESSSVLFEKGIEGAVRGAMKGVVPIP